MAVADREEKCWGRSPDWICWSGGGEGSYESIYTADTDLTFSCRHPFPFFGKGFSKTTPSSQEVFALNHAGTKDIFSKCWWLLWQPLPLSAVAARLEPLLVPITCVWLSPLCLPVP